MAAILGISAFYHDSAAVLLIDGEIIAAAQEERFTRKKHDPAFPVKAVEYVLQVGGILPGDLTVVAFYEKPFIKFERLLETYHAFVPRGLTSYLSAIPVWVKEKVFIKNLIRQELQKNGLDKTPLIFPEHHLSHAASAFYPSPFEEAAILTIDGVGEWATTTIGQGQDNRITMKRELHFPHSLGLLYSAFTYYCGFRVNSGEYKLMGLAPYGDEHAEQTQTFIRKILDELVDVRSDGSLLLNMKYFRYATGLRMTNDKKWEKLFGIPRRVPESTIGQDTMNMACAIQRVTEQIVMKLAATAAELTGSGNLVMAGGVALNSVANGKLVNSGLFDQVWIQPAAGDAGGALGAALAAWHIWLDKDRPVHPSDGMKGALLGPEYGDRHIDAVNRRYQTRFVKHDDESELYSQVAGFLEAGKVVGWFQGRMEYGPRALGNRSILGDARNPEMQRKMNLKIKFREGFRPFAPSVLWERTSDYFDIDVKSPYMLLVIPVVENHRNTVPPDYMSYDLNKRLYFLRSDIPAITHVDYSARIQTVHRDLNPRYWRLIETFRKRTGYGLVVNTSFNVRGEPIVCTPEDAYKCFMKTEMDVLVLGNHVYRKEDQPEFGVHPPK